MKRLVVVLAVAIAAVTLVGCGSGEEPATAPERTTVAVDEPTIEDEQPTGEAEQDGAVDACFSTTKGRAWSTLLNELASPPIAPAERVEFFREVEERFPDAVDGCTTEDSANISSVRTSINTAIADAESALG